MGGCSSKRIDKNQANQNNHNKERVLRIYRSEKPKTDKLDKSNFLLAKKLDKQHVLQSAVEEFANQNFKLQQDGNRLIFSSLHKKYELQIEKNGDKILLLEKSGNRLQQIFQEGQEVPFQIGETFIVGITCFTSYNFVTTQHQRNYRSLNPIVNRKQEMKTVQVCIQCQQPQSSNNRFFNSCSCKPNTRDIHLQCFKEKVIFNYQPDDVNRNSMIINCKIQECPLCFAKFIDSQAFNEFVCQLQTNFKQLLFPILILRAKLNINGVDYTSYFLHSFKNNKQFKIGRSQKCQLKIQIDTSLSREHAAIINKNGKIYIKDLGSTFGICRIWSNKCILNKGKSYNFKIQDKILSFDEEKKQSQDKAQ